MATITKRNAKKTAPPDDELTADDVFQPEAEDFTPEDIAVSNLLAELGDENVRVRVYRVGPKGYRDLTFIDEMDVSEFSPKVLKGPPFNGGTFRIHAAAPGAGGMRVNRELKVEPDPTPPPAPPSQSNAISAAELGAILAENNRQLLAGIMAAKPEVNPMGQIKDMVEVLAPLLNRPAPVVAPAPGIGDQIGTLSSILALAKQLAPQPALPEGADTSTLLLSKGLDFVERTMAQAQAARTVQPAQLAPADPAPPAIQLTPEQEEEIVLFRIAMRRACKAAADNQAPKDFATDNYEDIPESVLMGICNDPQWWNKLIDAYPDATPHKTWFEAVRVEFIAFAREDGLLPPEPANLTPPDASVSMPAGGKGEPDTGGVDAAGSEAIKHR